MSLSGNDGRVLCNFGYVAIGIDSPNAKNREFLLDSK